MNDNERDAAGDDERSVYIIIGRVYRQASGPGEEVHVLLTAPDDDSAVRMTLDALARYREVCSPA